MTATPDFRALCKELLVAIQLYTGLRHPAASEMSSVEITGKLMDAMAATAAALATPPPEPPTRQEIRKLWLDQFYFNADVGFDDFKSVVLAAFERWGHG